MSFFCFVVHHFIFHQVKCLHKTNQLDLLDSYLTKYHQYCTNIEHRIIFNSLYATKQVDLLDTIYDKFFGPTKIPYLKIPKPGDEDTEWDLHQYTIGVAAACIRHGSKQLRKGTFGFLLKGVTFVQLRVVFSVNQHLFNQS